MKKDLRRYLRLSIITAWQKLNEYYTNFGESPLFAASTILHPSLGKSYLEVNRASEEQVVWARDAKDGLSDYLDRWYRCNWSVNEQRGAIVKTTASPSVPQRTTVNSMLKHDLADYRVPQKLQDLYFYYGRWYGKSGNLPRENYIFPIDKEELARLDILHKFFLVVRKNHLFSASLDVEQPLRILDLGTGTGIWSIELSEKYPHMHVQGLDFNMIQPKMIPRTMAPPKPFDLEGSWDTADLDWDFMHVRTLFGSIQNWPDLYKKMIMLVASAMSPCSLTLANPLVRHLKPGWGCMEQVEIDWTPQCDDDSLPTDSALSEWASKLLDAMDQYGRPMRVNPEKTRRQLALAGFVDISETVIRACYNPWPEVATEKEAARWFNLGLSSGLTALSCAAMIYLDGKETRDRL
ncbi:hypothetical protein IWW34DRAFT_638831 [Fusarium oxysporum f. sp. albedinis]|nr:hypothetical protein IWW34DRAFT_638831 [Fusarium oxysporum f. sp. albedinis]